jgi:hypothetical protein
MEMTEACYVIRLGTDEFNAWADYFDRIVGRRPATMKMALNSPAHVGITMPTQWPQWFDSASANGRT